MLILTVHLGDEIVVQTPAGSCRLVIGGPNGVRRRLGIEAPTTFRVTRSRNRGRLPDRLTASLPASGNTAKGG